MNTLTIQMPDSIKSFVDAQSSNAGCSPDEFVLRVLQEFHRRREIESLEQKLEAGLNQLKSGECSSFTEQSWQAFCDRLSAKHPELRK